MEQIQQKGEEVLSKLDNKDFNMYFFVLDTKGNPVAGVANIYEHVKVLNELGYKAHIMHENDEYHGVANWLGSEYADLPHVSATSNVNMSAEDFLFIPEIFSNIMHDTRELPCKKVVFSQSYHYILELLNIGTKWTDYSYNDVITTSNRQSEYIKKLFPAINTHVVPISIPSYFKPNDLPQKPIVSIVTREQTDAIKIVKSFYLQYPLYKWVTFKELRGLSRKDFARGLSESCLAVWVDDVAGFGTFPLEAMESNVPMIGKIPNMIPEWMQEDAKQEGENTVINIKNNGVWTTDFLNIPELIATYMKVWLEDKVPQDLLEGIENSKGQYTEESQKTEIQSTYETLFSNRKAEIQAMVDNQNPVNIEITNTKEETESK